jgi:hypothetical protein
VKTWFFALKLPDCEAESPGPRFEIQLLDRYGACIRFVQFGADESQVMIEDYEVPRAVVERTKSLELGQGNYFDEQGEIVAPF